ncbi:hypothetical protein AHAS_Ahas17G0137300 [Arachis hypogaea]
MWICYRGLWVLGWARVDLKFHWRRELFQWELELLSELHEVLRPVNLIQNREDSVVWKLDRKGVFSTNSFVQVWQEELIPEEVTSYSFTKTIWKGLVLPRVELFTWFVLIGRVSTKDRLSRFGIIRQEDSICVFCHTEVEQVWSAWISTLCRQWAFPGSMREYFLSWTKEPRRKEDREQRLRCFCEIVWNIWLERNRRVFRNVSRGVEEIFNMTVMSANE